VGGRMQAAAGCLRALARVPSLPRMEVKHPMLMKKLAASLLVATACMSGALAQSMPQPDLSAKAWLLLDETSGQVIASH
ncbi:hypothetical protein, partial [Escherichia coli]|uniref:hypothetical protein n=1 Tax=Escherichia coli TaxID=562 RepID=UPI001EDC6508